MKTQGQIVNVVLIVENLFPQNSQKGRKDQKIRRKKVPLI